MIDPSIYGIITLWNDTNIMNECLTDFKYRQLLFKCLDRVPEFTGTYMNPKWQLDCPICGAKRAQLVWINRRDTYKFICPSNSRRNCGLHAEFPILLKVWNPPLYLQFLQERQEEGTAGAGWNVPLASEVTPHRRSQRRLNWRICQVHDQVNPSPPDPSEGWCWWSVDLVASSQLSWIGRSGVAVPSRWTRSYRFCRWDPLSPYRSLRHLNRFIQNTSQLTSFWTLKVVKNNSQDLSIDRTSQGVIPDW